MDPHLLRTFVTVTRLASFPAAARELGCTRAAVARHVAALERELGLPLLTRRPVVPTVAGARLLEHAVPLLLRLDAARAELTRLAAVPAGELTVAATPLAAGPRLLAALPGTTVRVTLRVRPHDAVPAALTDGTAHLGLVDGLSTPGDPLPPSEAAAPPAGTAPPTALRVSEAPLTVHLPAGHPLAHRRGLRLDELTAARWLDAPDAGLPLDRLRAAHGTYGFRPALRYDGTDVHTLTALVAAGRGLAVLPATVPAAPAATAVPLLEPHLVHRVELLHAAEPTGPAAELAARLTDGRGGERPDRRTDRPGPSAVV
ncbi:LysR family transcriptional regulator [Streptomyces somaliensis DSM 40738]|uniref:LysR family transcriptional regulator n=1 Tax=Streptomyces somaliensis TaxID=78355 RepID=UPI0021C46A41|nr:LysR family transcriptional regulator [Streptomyces somaliensis]MCQ0025110.1 LysR family transcriptional regulator [Streptomyces somaliensis DSM 40738]